MFGSSVLGLSSDDGISALFSLPLHTEELAHAHAYAPSSVHPIWQQPAHQDVAHLYQQQESAHQFGALPQGSNLNQNVQVVQGMVQNQFNATTNGGMFGLEPMGYHQSATLQPFAASSVPTDYPHFAPGGPGTGAVGSQGSDSEGTPEYTFADDSLTVWANAPTFYG